MKLVCTHCVRSFDSSEGYSGTPERPFCLQTLCLAAYFAPAGAVMQTVNGFDNEHYAESLSTRAKG